MLLAFETVARTASACVCDREGHVVTESDLGGGEAEVGLVGMLEDLSRRFAPWSALAVATGPGSFTGLRIGVTAARTLAWIENVPVHAVDALAARALQEGDGIWWVGVSLKRDTTFHGLFEVNHGRCSVLVATAAAADEVPPDLPERIDEAVAIGPWLTSKPGLAHRWHPGTRTGSSGPLLARGVAAAAAHVASLRWDAVVPAYHQEPAPVLQRRRTLERRQEAP